jgi:hypothetical protein
MSRRTSIPKTGERVELARYTVASGERILHGQRIGGVVRITDRPSQKQGRAYLVERGLERDGYSALKALVADYTRMAEEWDEVPMATSVVRHAIEQEAVDITWLEILVAELRKVRPPRLYDLSEGLSPEQLWRSLTAALAPQQLERIERIAAMQACGRGGLGDHHG